ncbi:pyridoxamine 5'-phosphate oxidase family protein [Phenylobacterium sp. J426]|uniref:pyridoxamine 5'-phosphate oxidase family protein n=1 Tax=Phenylobacterium sp. J426 TaxID=2898439 RepID=UPI002151B091|nr:pyridoxamine 5'-phosphate oxidase family protein [Phenylobacterium sp. J426]MCR5875528.1 pyridoxamine 5'-phosphate oxidase family protein [Phenylobacterium sp. J426]
MAIPEDLTAVLREGQDMTLATVMENGAPHATTVSYASDGRSVVFGCSAASQKARNLARDPRVALTITLPYRDWSQIRGLSAIGRARRLDGDEAAAAGLLFLQKFSELAQYVDTADSSELALFEIMLENVGVLDYRKGFGHVEHAWLVGEPA